MSQLTPEVSKLLEQALSLSVEEQEVLANSLISSLGSEVASILKPGWNWRPRTIGTGNAIQRQVSGSWRLSMTLWK